MQALWQTWLRPRILKYEEARREAAPKRLRLFVQLGGFVILYMFVGTVLDGRMMDGQDAFRFSVFSVPIVCVLLLGLYFISAPPHRVDLKRLVGGAAAEAWGIEYKPIGAVPKDGYGRSTLEVLQRGLLLPESVDAHFEDIVYGSRYGVDFDLVETILVTPGRRNRSIIFRGLLVRVAWHAVHETPVVFASSLSTERLELAIEKEWERIDTVSQPLDDTLAFYALDQVLGRAAIPPDRLEGLANLAQAYGLRFPRGVIMDGSLYLALQDENRFEVGRIWQSLDDPTHFTRLLDDMMFVCELVQAVAVPPSRMEMEMEQDKTKR